MVGGTPREQAKLSTKHKNGNKKAKPSFIVCVCLLLGFKDTQITSYGSSPTIIGGGRRGGTTDFPQASWIN